MRTRGSNIRERIAQAITLCLVLASSAKAQDRELQELNINPSFSKKSLISPSELIGLQLNRPLQASEGALAVFLGDTDITSLFISTKKGLNYSPNALQLPTGKTTIKVYLVSATNEWREVGTFPLVVTDFQDATGQSNERSGSIFADFVMTPALALNAKSESTLLFFPETNRPSRINFTDLSFQASLQTSLERGYLNYQNQFDFVGTTSQRDALRFADQENDAPQIDLSSYFMQVQIKKVKVLFGHHAYGTNRYLINNFSSRGIDVTLPFSSRFDVSFNAANGTSIVGWNNFSGLNKRNHKIVAGTFGSEFFPSHPGRLRLEVSALRGSLLPISNYNQQNVTDAETSRGLGARIVAADSKERFRLEVGYARSRFNNPNDPLLSQNFNTVPVRETTTNADYLDFSYQIFKDHSITKNNKANLTFAFHHNRVEPLFRSVAVYSQADRLDNQYELTGNIGEVTAGFVHNGADDNLDNVPSILKTLSRRNGFSLGLPLTSVFNKWNEWSAFLPRLAYNYERTHAFGAFLPINSGFALSHVPDQASTNQTLSAEWAHNSLRLGYRFNESFQDNRQVGRELSDFRTLVNAITFGIKPLHLLDLNFDLSSERATNLEPARVDRALRLALAANLATTKKSILGANIASNLASDALDTNRNRSIDLDVQWSLRFGLGKEKYDKVQGQFFVRYANRFARAQDRIFFLNNITKFQTMSAGLTLTFF